MPKISRPVVYTAVAAMGVYAVFLYTQPENSTSTAHKTRLTSNSNATTDVNGITAADLTAHYSRYKAGSRDPFVPQVMATQVGGGDKNGGGWYLTGIDTVNGVKSALIEDSSTGETTFVKPGDQWNGLHVVGIGADYVEFINALGQHTQLSFAQPPAEDNGTNNGNVPGAPPAPPISPGLPVLPSLSAIQPLPPLNPSATTNSTRTQQGSQIVAAPADASTGSTE